MKQIKKSIFALTYPNVDPIALSIGPIAIRWYGIAYIAGIFLGLQLAKKIAKKINLLLDIDNFVLSIVLGLMIGGRIGYVLFYDLVYYLQNPIEIIAFWKGGMSFHGGAIGAFIGALAFCKKQKLSFLKGADILAISVTPGLFFGRIANFINGELFGRPTSVSWGMVFPDGGSTIRHPSQLYEAGLEGIGLFLILFVVFKYYYKPGRLFSFFMIGYAIFRFFIEFTRQPDHQLGLLIFNLSMGQFLSIAMLILGFIWIYATNKKLFY